MSRKKVSLADYVSLAERRLLAFVGPMPDNKATTTLWRCLLTNAEVRKSYASVISAQYGSRYQRHYAQNLEKYQALADRLDIEFVYEEGEDYFPKNNKAKARWRGRGGGEIVVVSYHEIGYGFIKQELCDRLGLIYREVNDRPGRYGRNYGG